MEVLQLSPDGSKLTNEIFRTNGITKGREETNDQGLQRFRTQGLIVVNGCPEICVVNVNTTTAELCISVPALNGSFTLHMTPDNFTLDVVEGHENGLIVQQFNEQDELVGTIQLHFLNAYSVTRVIFMLFMLRADVSLRGICHLANACSTGSVQSASSEVSFCKKFFVLHKFDLARYFPGNATEFYLKLNERA